MIRTKLAAVSAAVALVAVPLAASPAAAQPVVGVDLPCEVFADPYGYPCGVAEQTANFGLQQAGQALQFVGDVRDEAGEIAFRVYCIAFPNQPQCW